MPDPAGLAAVDLTNPQTWNRYAYVANNPLSNVDPLGLDDGDPWSEIPSDCFFNIVFCAGQSAAAYEYCVFIGMCGSNNSGGGSSGGGGSPPPSTPPPSTPPPQPVNFPNETLGIPNGLNVNFGGIWGAIIPTATCGDLGPCNPIGSGFDATEAAALPVIAGICFGSGVCETAAMIGGAIAGGYVIYKGV